jgi:BlaI family penicillinase repressor
MKKLTAQEEEAMLIIWKIGEGCVKDYLDNYPEPRLPYTTLASVVKNIERKNFISSRKIGNVYLYHPIISQEEYQQAMMSGVVKDYFSDSYKELVTFFAKEQKISSEELKEIIKLIETNAKTSKS